MILLIRFPVPGSFLFLCFVLFGLVLANSYSLLEIQPQHHLLFFFLGMHYFILLIFILCWSIVD